MVDKYYFTTNLKGIHRGEYNITNTEVTKVQSAFLSEWPYHHPQSEKLSEASSPPSPAAPTPLLSHRRARPKL